MSTGGTLVGPASLSTTTLADLGTAKTIEARKNWSTFVGGHGDPDLIDERIEQLQEEIQQTDSLKECEAIQRRINRSTALAY